MALDTINTSFWQGVDLVKTGVYCIYDTGCQVCSRVGDIASATLDWTFPRNPVSHARQFRIIPAKVESFIGGAHYNSLCPQGRVCQDKKLTDQVEQVFRKLTKVCDRELDYEIRVEQNDKVVNAFCLPGGKTVITTGLIKKLQADLGEDIDDQAGFEDRLAGVLGHELTHACAAHGAMRIQMAAGFWGAGKIMSFLIPSMIEDKSEKDPKVRQAQQKKSQLAKGSFNLLWTLGTALFSKQYGQSEELQSGRVGMKYAYKAGFKPEGAVWVQKMFLKEKGDSNGIRQKTMELFSTHPPSKLRVAKIEEALKTLKEKGVEVLT